MILAGRRINDGMHEFVVEKIQKEIIKRKLLLKNFKILVLGVSFKEDCNDTRNSKSYDLIKSLSALDVELFHSEPYINGLKIKNSLILIIVNFFLVKIILMSLLLVSHTWFLEKI